MLYYGFKIEKCGEKLVFSSPNTTLEFASDGNLCALELDGRRFEMSSPEVNLVIGGCYHSTLTEGVPSKNWPQLVLDGTETLTPESRYVSHRAVKRHDSVTLELTVALDELEMVKKYTVNASYVGFSRSFELTNRGEALTVRSVGFGFPTLEGFSPMPAIVPSKVVTDGKVSITARFDPRSESVGIRPSLETTVKIENKFETGDSFETGEFTFELIEADGLTAVGIVRDRLEAIGHRAHRENEAMLRSLTCYEVEIGPLKLSETKCHHRYDHPTELAADLERIKALGYNTVEMMPSFLFPCYTVYDLKNPDIQHGRGESIRPVIERAHELGMKVILDILMHGCIDTEIADFDREHMLSRRYYWPEWQRKIPELVGKDRARVNPLREEHPDWFIYEKPGKIFRGYTWIFDHANPGFQQYFADAMEISVTDWGVDGFRFDAPTWECGVNSSEELAYSGSRSLHNGHCELFRKTRNQVDRAKPGTIFIVEGPYYEFADTCDISYSYDQYGHMKNIFAGKSTAKNLREYLDLRDRCYPHGALWLNFADNHDTWNNGVVEDGLYSFERFGFEFAKAVFALACFVKGGVQCFGGYEDSSEEFAEFTREMLAKRRDYGELVTRSEVSYPTDLSDARLIRVVHAHGEQRLTVTINLSGDGFDCAEGAFAPYEVKFE